MARRFFVALIVILLAISFPFTKSKAGETEISPVAKEGIDAILLIDTSGSMRFSDSERTALEAAAMFIDMMETNNSRVGVIAFTDELQSVIPLTPVGSTEDKEDIKRRIQRFSYYGYTDIGMSLTEAVDMIMTDVSPSNSPVMVLLTDGAIEINPSNPERTVEMSNDDVRAALGSLNGGAPIYTIGLNADDTVDTAFLHRVSNETMGRTYIALDASELPGIFNEIFADHIRSSLIEVAAFETEEGQYTDIKIPINNAFVAEANIIMLSSQPLEDVKLLNPSREEAAFNSGSVSFTHSDRYSMVKIVSPQEGDWLLSVKGLPDDKVTVNLIYNFNVDVAVSVTQEGQSGELFDKKLPLQVTAAFVSAYEENLPADIYTAATASLKVYNLNLNEIESIPMTQNGESFIAEYFPDDARDVRFSVHTSHAEFEKSSDYIAISYEQPLIAEPETQTPAASPEPTAVPEQTAEPEPTAVIEPSAVPEPTASPEPEASSEPELDTSEPAADDKGSMLIKLGAAAGILLVAAGIFLAVKNSGGNKAFTGYMEVRAKLDNGKYTALETPDLSRFAGKTTLFAFLNSTLSSKSAKLLQTSICIGDLHIRPGSDKGKPYILLDNMGSCIVKDKDGNVIGSKKIDWRDDQKLVLTASDTKAKIEITYRAGRES